MKKIILTLLMLSVSCSKPADLVGKCFENSYTKFKVLEYHHPRTFLIKTENNNDIYISIDHYSKLKEIEINCIALKNILDKNK